MNLLDTLTLAADEEQLRLHPLPVHAAATQSEHLRRHYALLLAAVLTAQPAISEPQTRLLRLLLDALKLGDIRGQLFEEARKLEPAPLLEAARLIREAGFAHHLIVDVLVLLRLDAPLDDEAARLVGELAAFLGLNETKLAMRAADAAEILGLNANEDRNTSADGADAGKEGDGNGEAEEPAPERFSLAEFWPAHLRQPLTVEALRAGLKGGAWVLDTGMTVDFPWQAQDAVLFFRNGAVLSTASDQGEVKLTGCRLVDAVLSFTGKCRILLERCDWRGDYDPKPERTALKTSGSALTVTNSQFSTRNARAISVTENTLNLTGCRFIRCGHAELNGGAVYHFSGYSRTIENCYFDRCLASYGGAIYVYRLYGVHQCEFVACQSRALQNQGAGDIAVYAEENSKNPVITRCVFRHTSIYVGDSYHGYNRKIAVNCQFINGNLYHYRNDHHTFNAGGIFTFGRVIGKEL